MADSSKYSQQTDPPLTDGETRSLPDFDFDDTALSGNRAANYSIEFSGRYRVLGELGHGGMGVVYRAMDNVLGREIAVKTLREFPCSAVLLNRFLHEAEVTSQLQHPAIPATYDLIVADGQPFLMLKLIKGSTLDVKIESATLAANRGELIAIFERVCQAVAYAHERRVIHRDLKPSNVMVGAFGEVLVLDWGLAKRLTSSEECRTEPASDEVETHTEIRTSRESCVEQTFPGCALGTPAFTSPEQTAGEIEKMDERADVFGLGALLCALLTGKPPYVADSKAQVKLMAIRGELEEAFSRLDASGADAELVTLCKHCLARDPVQRPRNATAVANAMASYRSGVERRLQDAREATAVAAAEVREQRKRRRIQLALLSSLFLMVMGATGAGWWNRQQRFDMIRRSELTADETLMHAELLAAQAREAGQGIESVARAEASLARWQEAKTTADQATRIIADSIEPELIDRFAGRIAEIHKGWQESETMLTKVRRDQRLIQSLEKAHDLSADLVRTRPVSHQEAAETYSAAFKTARLPVDGSGSPEAFAAAFSRECASVQKAIMDSIDHWAWCLDTLHSPHASWVRRAADLIDSDAFRSEARRAIAYGNKWELLNLASHPESKNLPPATAILIGRSLVDYREQKTAAFLLYEVQKRNPTDYWTLIELAESLKAFRRDKSPVWIDAIGCLRTALALRPGNAMTLYRLGYAFSRNDDALSAESYYQQAIEKDPTIVGAQYNLGCIHEQKLPPDFVRAEQYFRKAVELDENFAMARAAWGATLSSLGRSSVGEAQLRTAIKHEPGLGIAHTSLGYALVRQRRYQEALDSFKKGTQVADPPASSWFGLGEAQSWILDWDGAEKSFRKGVQVDPGSAEAHKYLGNHLLLVGKLSEARAVLEASLKAYDSDCDAVCMFGRLKERLGDSKAAKHEYERAVAMEPRNLAAAFEYDRLEQGYGTPAELSNILAHSIFWWQREWSPRQKRAAMSAAAIAAISSARSNLALAKDIRSDHRRLARELLNHVLAELSASLYQAPETSMEEILVMTSEWLGCAELSPMRRLLPLQTLPPQEAKEWFELVARIRALHDNATGKIERP